MWISFVDSSAHKLMEYVFLGLSVDESMFFRLFIVNFGARIHALAACVSGFVDDAGKGSTSFGSVEFTSSLLFLMGINNAFSNDLFCCK